MSSVARRLVLSCALGGSLLIAGMAAAPTAAQSCDGSYPTICIPPIYESGDLDCADIPAGGFTVLQPDPHYLDGDYDGIGCEWN